MFFNRTNKTTIIASAHKVGSTWIFDILKSYLQLNNHFIPPNARANIHNSSIIDLQNELSLEWLVSLKGDNILKSHSFPPSENPNPKKLRFVTVIRDPRDLMVSSIHYLTNLDPKLGGWDTFRNLKFEDKAKIWLERNVIDFQLLKAWNDYKNAYKFKYEDLLINPEREMLDFLSQSGEKINKRKLINVLEANSFENKANRKPGEENSNSFFRKGIANDWENYFSEEIKELFKSVYNSQWNRLLIELGYEKSEEW